jgi:hypothetical protein
MNRIIRIKLLGGYKIEIHFNDGSVKIVNFRHFIGKGISQELLDENYFSKAEIENGGGLAWPNGYDFCPNFLHDYEEIGKSKAISEHK